MMDTFHGIERRHSLSASLWLEGVDGQPVTRTIPVGLRRSLAVATHLQRAPNREGAMLKTAVLTMLLQAVAMPTAPARAQEEPPRSGAFARIGLGLGNVSTTTWGWPG
jgi:hypothetical protein